MRPPQVVPSLSVCLLSLLCGCAADAAVDSRPDRGGSGSAGVAPTPQNVAGSPSGPRNFDNPGLAPIAGTGAPIALPEAGAMAVKDESCGKITAIVRDFTPATNPDFEHETGFDLSSLLTGSPGMKGLVKPMLEHGYPAYAHPGATAVTTGPEEFYQWYVDTPGVNMRFEIPLPLTEVTPGHFVYDSAEFFPIDGMGFGNFQSHNHNYHFTSEIRTKFTYRGGEVFTFRGDDDVWIFVNGTLAVDLGGMHSPLEGVVDMDQFALANGLTRGETYPMDVFQAERHTTGSTFRIETTIECVTPAEPPPPPPPPRPD